MARPKELHRDDVEQKIMAALAVLGPDHPLARMRVTLASKGHRSLSRLSSLPDQGGSNEVSRPVEWRDYKMDDTPRAIVDEMMDFVPTDREPTKLDTILVLDEAKVLQGQLRISMGYVDFNPSDDQG